MAYLISRANGNLSGLAATWGLCGTQTGMYQDTLNPGAYTFPAASGSTAYNSAVWVPTANLTVDGFAVRVASNTQGTGGVAINLFQYVSGTWGAVIGQNFNLSALPPFGWVLLTGTPFTMSTANQYLIQIYYYTGAANQIGFYYDNATAGNWDRLIRTTTQQAPVAGDIMYVLGAYTSASSNTPCAVTVNNPGTGTTYGANGGRSLTVGYGGSLNWPSTTTPNRLWLGGYLQVDGGTVNMGTASAPITAGSYAELGCNCTVSGQGGIYIENGGVFNAYGTANRNYNRVLLTADAVAGQPTIIVNNVVNWVAGDTVYLTTTDPCTVAWPSVWHEELLTVSSVSGHNVTFTTNLAYAHSGSAGTQAEAVLWGTTSNCTASQNSVVVRGVNYNAIWQGYAGSTININNLSGYRAGTPIMVSSADTMANCQFDGGRGSGTYSTALHCTGSGTITGNIFANLYSYSYLSTTSNYTFTNNLLMMCAGGIYFEAAGVAYNGNKVIGACTIGYPGIYLAGTSKLIPGSFNNNTVCCCYGNGMQILNSQNTPGAPFTGNACWRNHASGININSNTGIQLANCSSYGNIVAGVSLNTAGIALYMSGCSLTGGTTYVQPYGLVVSYPAQIVLESCTLTGNSTSSISPSQSQIITRNCQLAISGLTLFPNTGPVNLYQYITCTDYNNPSYTAIFMQGGWLYVDSLVYYAGGKSLRMIPYGGTTYQCQSSIPSKRWLCPVNSGDTVTISVWTRQGLATDPGATANYSGKQPQLYLDQNVVMGIASPTLLATSTAALGIWQQLTGSYTATVTGVLGFYVEINGYTGYVYVGPVAFQTNRQLSGLSYNYDGGPLVVSTNNSLTYNGGF